MKYHFTGKNHKKKTIDLDVWEASSQAEMDATVSLLMQMGYTNIKYEEVE